MAKYEEYIFNGTNYIKVGGSVASRLVVTATGSPTSLTLSSTFSDILSAIQSGVDVVINRSNAIYYLEYFDASKITFREMDSFLNAIDDDSESIQVTKIVVTSDSAKFEYDSKNTPIVLLGSVVTGEGIPNGYYVDINTTLSDLTYAVSIAPIMIGVEVNQGEFTWFYSEGIDRDGDVYFNGSYTTRSDAKYDHIYWEKLHPYKENTDGSLRCEVNNYELKFPIFPTVSTADSGKFLRVNSLGHWAAEKVLILPTVSTADSGKFLRVNSLGNWAAEKVPNAEGGTF